MKKIGGSYPKVNTDALCKELSQFVISLNTSLSSGMDPAQYAQLHFDASFSRDTRKLNAAACEQMLQSLGFNIERQPSTVENAGQGVLVTKGKIEPNKLVALYPG